MIRVLTILVKLTLLSIVISLAACKGLPAASPELELERKITSPQEGEKIPVIPLPSIDGKINSREWQAAVVERFPEGSELYLLVDGEYLYVGIRNTAGGMIAGNVFLEQGDRVIILHTSAALGTAIYQLEGKSFRKTKDFEWCCRSKLEDEASRSAREIFFDQEGWLGQNSFIGEENEIEYLISLDGDPTRLAVNFIYADGGGEKQVWPAGLEDGVALPAEGGYSDWIEFSVEEWIPIEDYR